MSLSAACHALDHHNAQNNSAAADPCILNILSRHSCKEHPPVDEPVVGPNRGLGLACRVGVGPADGRQPGSCSTLIPGTLEARMTEDGGDLG